jgi:alpha-beta hydrolase superfamily lysophospholipase
VNLLSHDQQVVRDYVADEYNIDFASLRTLVDVLTRGPELKYYVKDFNIPVAIAHGGSDGITE